MSAAKSKTPVYVAVTLVHHGKRLLLVYNRAWHCFTFPMTRLRDWEVNQTSPFTAELQGAWKDAAAHAAAECVGTLNKPHDPNPGIFAPPVDLNDRSARTGETHFYHYKVFSLTVDTPDRVLIQPHLWLTAQEIAAAVANDLRPLSPTVHHLLADPQVQQEIARW